MTPLLPGQSGNSEIDRMRMENPGTVEDDYQMQNGRAVYSPDQIQNARLSNLKQSPAGKFIEVMMPRKIQRANQIAKSLQNITVLDVLRAMERNPDILYKRDPIHRFKNQQQTQEARMKIATGELDEKQKLIDLFFKSNTNNKED